MSPQRKGERMSGPKLIFSIWFCVQAQALWLFTLCCFG
ncbi:hypothetical protein BT93_K2426 [Corymbia citriodora subsp. variegata]|nr:hypothetical protein BT93_K2426 [Corymbia citriodora subsp. variegata]